MIPNLTSEQLTLLLHSVFAPGKTEKDLSILVDLPDSAVRDDEQWQDRRIIATGWYEKLQQCQKELPFTAINLYAYGNVGSNNNDLPQRLHKVESVLEAGTSMQGRGVATDAVLASSSVVLSLTKFSATAPLKVLARKHGFRGATLPGFLRSMIPTLALDYEKVNARVIEFKDRMDRAESVDIRFTAEGRSFECMFDLRFREGHASGGLMREAGVVGNLPSGEAYIVPYEGERPNQPSLSHGILPVQFENEIVQYRIEHNRAIEILSKGAFSSSEAKMLAQEPAYGNIAEIGIGVLGEWGVEAVGSTLVDEKLGLHIAFGRSEHFGGIVSPASFNDPKKVVHIDRVYVPSTQPRVHVEEVVFVYPGAAREIIMKDGTFQV